MKNLYKLTSDLSQYISAAERRWPGCIITGNGPFAAVAHDQPPVVNLQPTKRRARKAIDQIYLGVRDCGEGYIRLCSVIDLREAAR